LFSVLKLQHNSIIEDQIELPFIFGDFRHNFTKNGPHYLQMVQKDASGNSTQSVIKNQVLNKKPIGKVTVILVLRSWNANC
jgi:hypothetical protein